MNKRVKRPGRALVIGLLLLLGAATAYAFGAAAAPTPKAVHPPIIIHHGQWQCRGPQDHTIVIVQDPIDKNGDPYTAAVSLGDGCTGTIGAIIVEGNQRDGIKVGGTAHDLEILSGWIWCGPRIGDVHQDGVQAGGGSHVHFHALHVDCPESNNAAFFINQTNGGSGVRPTDITCAGCDLLSNNNAFNVGEESVDSGVRNSILRRGKGGSAPSDCYRSNGQGAVTDSNVCTDGNTKIDMPVPAG